MCPPAQAGGWWTIYATKNFLYVLPLGQGNCLRYLQVAGVRLFITCSYRMRSDSSPSPRQASSCYSVS